MRGRTVLGFIRKRSDPESHMKGPDLPSIPVELLQFP